MVLVNTSLPVVCCSQNATISKCTVKKLDKSVAGCATHIYKFADKQKHWPLGALGGLLGFLVGFQSV